MANGHGGVRPGAGRKVAPEIEEFRQWVRRYFRTKQGRAELRRRMKDSDVILAKVLSLAYPTPIAVDIDAPNGPIPVRLVRE